MLRTRNTGAQHYAKVLDIKRSALCAKYEVSMRRDQLKPHPVSRGRNEGLRASYSPTGTPSVGISAWQLSIET